MDAVDAWRARLEQLRGRVRPLDVALLVQARDKEAGGTLLGSALALRLFLFFVPMVLTVVGLAGLLGRYTTVDSMSSTVGISGTLANEIDAAFDQGATAPWLAAVVGLFGMATTGRSLTRALVLSSALSWELGGRQRLGVRAVGIVIGIVVGMALATSVLNHVRAAAGVALDTISFAVLGVVYLVLWVPLFLALPRRSADPGAALPGAAVMAVLMTALQMVTTLYLPQQIEGASSLYGGLGVAVATLGWFFFIGRALALGFAMNAVLYEEIGTVSRFVFGLPVLRSVPIRVPWVARFFDLPRDHEPPSGDRPGRLAG